MIIGGLQAAFTKIGLAHPHEHYPYEPYRNPEPTRSIRRSTSQLFTRPRKVSVLESACLTVHKIPAIVAVSGSPDTPTPRARLYSGPSRPGAPRDHHPPTPGWHRLLSPVDASTNRAFPSQNDVPSGTRTDRSHTVPAPINAVPPSFDFRELDQVKQPQSAPSQTTTFNLPDIQVTAAERRPTEANYQQAPPPPPSFDFIDMDRDSSAPLVRSSSPSLSSMHRPPSPAMGQSYRSVSPSVGHTPYYPVSQRRDSSLRTSYVAPQRSITPVPRTDSVSPATQAAIPESYDFIMSDRLSPTTHENPNYGAHYCTSPMPIYTYGSTHGTSRGNAYDSGRGDVYDATQESTNASTRDVYDATRGVVHGSAQSRGGATDMTHGQPTGLTAIIGEMEDYNRDSVPRSVPASFPSPTTTVSVDGTLDSPYLDRDPTSSNSF